jgi:hypothetical protein
LFCLWSWGLNWGPTSWATPPALFGDKFFICPGCLLTEVFLISASFVARITGVNHWHPGSCLQHLLQILFQAFLNMHEMYYYISLNLWRCILNTYNIFGPVLNILISEL